MVQALESVIQFVNDTFAGKEMQIKHFQKTLERVIMQNPNADQSFQIAAYSHDIERWFRDPSHQVPENYLDIDFLRYHQEKWAEIIKDFLIQHGYSTDVDIDRVVHLISKHEQGWDTDQNILMNADSASFLETNAYIFIEKKAKEEWYEKVKEKIDWMYNRISDPQIKKQCQQLYLQHIENLKKICNKQ